MDCRSKTMAGLEGAGDPGATDESRDLEERVAEVLLARGEVGREGGAGEKRAVGQQREMVFGPAIEAVAEGLNLVGDVVKIEAFRDFCGQSGRGGRTGQTGQYGRTGRYGGSCVQGFEDYWDAAVG